MKKTAIIVLTIFITALSFSKTITGVGKGKSKSIAKKEALSDLSNQIEVTIKSTFQSNSKLNNGKTNKNISSDINTTSKTHLLGVDFKITKRWYSSTYSAVATLDDSKIKIYDKKANDLKSNILRNYDKASNTADLESKLVYLQNVLRDYKKFDSYKNVAIILGSNRPYSIYFSKSEIQNEINSLNKKADYQSLYQGKKILYIKSSGQFKENSKNYLDNYFNTIIASISNKNSNKIAINSTNDSTVTTLVKIVLNNSSTVMREPVFYNHKIITPSALVTTVSITVVIYNKNSLKNILTISSIGKGEDNSSKKISYRSAVKNAFSQMKDNLQKALIN